MFIKFQAVRGGSVYIRAEDWRSMVDEPPSPRSPYEDQPIPVSYEEVTRKLPDNPVVFDDPPARCRVSYVPQGTTDLITVLVLGTADENYDRIRNDEMKVALEYEKMRQRESRGLPSIPVQRGRGGGS